MDYLITKNDVIYRCTSDILEHHGIKGQKWGVRRYQNSDGSLTPMGKIRYGNNPERYKKDLAATEARESAVSKINSREREIKAMQKRYRKAGKEINKTRSLASRFVTAWLAGPFANSLYADYLVTDNSKKVANNKTIINVLREANFIDTYQLLKTRQLARAANEYDKKHPDFDLVALQRQKAQAEQDFKRKK